MTTTAEILAKWKASVFDSAEAQAITTIALDYDALSDIESLSELTALFSGTQINCFVYTAYRMAETGSIRGTNSAADRFTHYIRVDYILEKISKDGAKNYNPTIDALEVVDDLVRSDLGKSWGGLVDFHRCTGFSQPTIIDIQGRKAWRAGYTYEGVKTV